MFASIGSSINGGIAILFVFGACVLFHEFGHFVSAKLIGMRVHEFAVGFGRRLWGFRRGETEYRINLVPLGGYVRIAGMEPGAEAEERGFYTYARWKGALALFAGSFMNVVLAALAFMVIAVSMGVPAFPGHVVNIRKVMPNSPAAQAGIHTGDRIVAIDGMSDSLLIDSVKPDGLAAQAGLGRYDIFWQIGGKQIGVPPELLAAMIEARKEQGPDGTLEVQIGRYTEQGTLLGTPEISIALPRDLPDEARPGQSGPYIERALGLTFVPLGHDSALSYISARAGKTIVLTVDRDGHTLKIPVAPAAEWDRVPEENAQGQLDMVRKSVGRIGVVLGGGTRPVGLGEAVGYGVVGSIDAVRMVADGLVQMFSGRIALQASGPVGIAAEAADRARIGWTSVVMFVGIISVNLAVINLFPFPPFDGFRIVLLGIEAIMRRRVSPKTEIGVTVAGVAVVIGLFLIITFKDLFNLVLFGSP